MARKRRPDYLLFALTIALIVVGVVFVFEASSVLAADKFGDPLHFAKRQVVWSLIGIVIFLITLYFPYRVWAKPSVLWSAFFIEVGLLVWALFNPTINGAHRWILLGPLSFQPAELAKPLVICLTAAILIRAKERDRKPLSAMGQTAIPVAILFGLILQQPDFGTVVILVLLLLALWMLWGMPWRILGTATAIGGILILILIASSDYRRQRIVAFLHPEQAAQHSAFQLQQSLIALGSGGVKGRFFGGSTQKARFLPEPHNDFIFAIVGEELGFVGTTALVLLFLSWAGLAFRTAVKVKDPFGGLVAMGITTWVTIQALLNMAVVTGLLPTKGLPLPFISYGGSSLVILCLGVGILANVSWERA